MKSDKCLNYRNQPIGLLFVNLLIHCFGIGSTIAISPQRNGLSSRSESAAFHHRFMGHGRIQKRSKKVLGVIMMRPSEHNLTADGVTYLAPVSSVDKAVLRSLNISVPSNTAIAHQSQSSQQTSQDLSTGFKNDFNSQENKTNTPHGNQFGFSEPTSYIAHPSDTSASAEPHSTSGLSVVPENSLKDSKPSKTLDIASTNASADHLTHSKKPEAQNQNQEVNKKEPNLVENNEVNKTFGGSLTDQKQGNASSINETQSQSNGNQTKPVDDWQYLSSSSQLIISDIIPATLTLILCTITLI